MTIGGTQLYPLFSRFGRQLMHWIPAKRKKEQRPMAVAVMHMPTELN
jgi:hypothetical protein